MSSYDEQRDIEAEGQRAAVFYSKRRQRDLARQAEAAGFVPASKTDTAIQANTAVLADAATPITKGELLEKMLEAKRRIEQAHFPEQEIQTGSYENLKATLSWMEGSREFFELPMCFLICGIPVRVSEYLPVDRAVFVADGEIRATLKLRPAK